MSNLFASKTVTAMVGGKNVQFFPLSMGNLYRLKTLMQPLAVLISNLMAKPQQDNNSMVEKQTVPDEQGKPKVVTETAHISATDVTLARFRADRRDKMVGELVSALMSDDNKLMVGRLITDSIRTQFDHKLSDPEVLEFLDRLDLPVMGELVQGFMQANKGVLGPLGPRILDLFRSRIQSDPVESSSVASGPQGIVPSETQV